MNVTVLGATGVLGRNVIPLLRERGHTVSAVVRRQGQAEELERHGVRAFPGDILEETSLVPALEGCDCVLHIATAIPRDRRGGDWSSNNRIRREGTRNLLRSATEAAVRRYIQQSIIMLYGDCGPAIVDEQAPLRPPPSVQSAYDMEQQVMASALEWCILRGGHFYGPSTGTEEQVAEAARAGELRIPSNGDALLSFIHVADMARAVVACAERAPARSVYNVVDDAPITCEEWYVLIAGRVHAPLPGRSGETVQSLGCSNAKLRSDLGWAPLFPTVRQGLA